MSLRTGILHSLDPAAFFEAATGFPADDWQADLLRSPAQQIALLCARQTGKSTTSGVYALWVAIYRAPALVLLLSPSQRQSAELFRTVTTCLHRLGTRVPIKAESVQKLELVNGSRIISLPGAENTVRGYASPSCTVIDESSRVEDSLYFSIRPMRATQASGKLICLTTPNGRRGWFYELWARDERFLKIRRTALQCSRISADFLEQERLTMPDYLFRQEYLCVFVDTALNPFHEADIHAAVRSDISPMFPGRRFGHDALPASVLDGC